ncbi:MAG: hypothetical protein ABF990_11145 [Acetobacter sp.]|uniref:hypothetical protein n=1 Tax=Acetobacter sp. TaxID=440 RepID=UPI0039E891A6
MAISVRAACWPGVFFVFMALRATLPAADAGMERGAALACAAPATMAAQASNDPFQAMRFTPRRVAARPVTEKTRNTTYPSKQVPLPGSSVAITTFTAFYHAARRDSVTLWFWFHDSIIS